MVVSLTVERDEKAYQQGYANFQNGNPYDRTRWSPAESGYWDYDQGWKDAKQARMEFGEMALAEEESEDDRDSLFG